MANSSTGTGRETNHIREWESQVGVALMTKESQLQQAQQEKQNLEAEIKQLLILNGELTQSIKAENDAAKKYEAHDKLLSEDIADTEADFKIIQMCIEEQEDCLRVVGTAQQVLRNDTNITKCIIEGETTDYSDKVHIAEKDLNTLQEEAQVQEGNRNMKLFSFDKMYKELNEIDGKTQLESEKYDSTNEKDNFYLIELQNKHRAMQDNLGNAKMNLSSIRNEIEDLAQADNILKKSIEDSLNQLESQKLKNFCTEEKMSKFHYQTESLQEEFDGYSIQRNSILESIQSNPDVIGKLHDLKAQISVVSQNVEDYQQEADRLNCIEDKMRDKEAERSKLLGNNASIFKLINDTNEMIKEVESIEEVKDRINNLIFNKNEEIQTEKNKIDQYSGDMKSKQEFLKDLEEKCTEKYAKLSDDNVIFKEQERLLLEEINPMILKLEELKDMYGIQEKQLVSKEIEKKDMLTLVSRRTNEVHLESKAKLAALAANLDENLKILRDLTSEVGKLENDITNKEHYHIKEWERISLEERDKVDLAVKPVLKNYEETQVKKMESEWEQFKSPAQNKRIQFAKKGKNLETASPFDVVLDSQEKTNQFPKLNYQPTQS